MGKRQRIQGRHRGSFAGRGIESACAERQKVVCLVSSWLESHVVPALIISKARARVSGAGYFLLVFVVMSCYFSLLVNFQGCDFWVVRISCSEYSCTRKAHFDPDCHRCRIIFSQPMVMSPGDNVGYFCSGTWVIEVDPGLQSFFICLFFLLYSLANLSLQYYRIKRYCAILFIGNWIVG